jgi:hypothetical protein
MTAPWRSVSRAMKVFCADRTVRSFSSSRTTGRQAAGGTCRFPRCTASMARIRSSNRESFETQPRTPRTRPRTTADGSLRSLTATTRGVLGSSSRCDSSSKPDSPSSSGFSSTTSGARCSARTRASWTENAACASAMRGALAS